MPRTKAYRSSTQYRNAELYQGDPLDTETFGRVEANIGTAVLVNEREAEASRVESNTGVNIANEREAESPRVESNTGVDLANAREDYGRVEAGDIDTSVPTPHIWYLRPNFGREGWEFKIVGHGFGATQVTYDQAKARLNDLECGVIAWAKINGTANALNAARTIDPNADVADPEHEEIRVTVPVGGQSGLVFVEHNEP